MANGTLRLAVIGEKYPLRTNCGLQYPKGCTSPGILIEIVQDVAKKYGIPNIQFVRAGGYGRCNETHCAGALASIMNGSIDGSAFAFTQLIDRAKHVDYGPNIVYDNVGYLVGPALIKEVEPPVHYTSLSVYQISTLVLLFLGLCILCSKIALFQNSLSCWQLFCILFWHDSVSHIHYRSGLLAALFLISNMLNNIYQGCFRYNVLQKKLIHIPFKNTDELAEFLTFHPDFRLEIEFNSFRKDLLYSSALMDYLKTKPLNPPLARNEAIRKICSGEKIVYLCENLALISLTDNFLDCSTVFIPDRVYFPLRSTSLVFRKDSEVSKMFKNIMLKLYTVEFAEKRVFSKYRIRFDLTLPDIKKPFSMRKIGMGFLFWIFGLLLGIAVLIFEIYSTSFWKIYIHFFQGKCHLWSL